MIHSPYSNKYRIKRNIMSKSLQEQLMAAGLSDKKKSKAIHKEKRQTQKQAKGTKKVSESQLLAEQAIQEKAEKAKQHNLAIQRQKDAKALEAQIKQIVELNTIKAEKDDVSYNFVSETKKIKKLHIDQQRVDHLSAGKLAIIKLGEQYVMIPTTIAEKVKLRSDDYFIYIADNTDNIVDEDDPYADYQIPDDLMW